MDRVRDQAEGLVVAFTRTLVTPPKADEDLTKRVKLDEVLKLLATTLMELPSWFSTITPPLACIAALNPKIRHARGVVDSLRSSGGVIAGRRMEWAHAGRAFATKLKALALWARQYGTLNNENATFKGMMVLNTEKVYPLNEGEVWLEARCNELEVLLDSLSKSMYHNRLQAEVAKVLSFGGLCAISQGQLRSYISDIVR